MAEFNELIKHFNKVRTYVRDFYVYGFKSRMDYPESGRRTYDNERRRIESWFADYIQYDYDSSHKKNRLPSLWTATGSTVIRYLMYGKPKALQIMILCCTFFCWI